MGSFLEVATSDKRQIRIDCDQGLMRRIKYDMMNTAAGGGVLNTLRIHIRNCEGPREGKYGAAADALFAISRLDAPMVSTATHPEPGMPFPAASSY